MNQSIQIAFGNLHSSTAIKPEDFPINRDYLVRTASCLFPIFTKDVGTKVFYYRYNLRDYVRASTDEEIAFAMSATVQADNAVFTFKVEVEDPIEMGDIYPSADIFAVPHVQSIEGRKWHSANGDAGTDSDTASPAASKKFVNFSVDLGVNPCWTSSSKHTTHYTSSKKSPALISGAPSEYCSNPGKNRIKTKPGLHGVNSAAYIPSSDFSAELGARLSKISRRNQNLINYILADSENDDIDTRSPAVPSTPSTNSSPLSSMISNEMGATVIDIAELLLHRGIRKVEESMYNDAFNYYNEAYQLLFETVTIDFSETEKLQVIRTQLYGLTQESLLADIGKLYILLTVSHLKEEGDTLFAGADFDAAQSKYTEALTMIDSHPGCLSNRAACKLALDDARGCIFDASLALLSLGMYAGTISATFYDRGFDIHCCRNMSEREREVLTVQALLRRGTALSQLNRQTEAMADFLAVLVLDPHNEAAIGSLNFPEQQAAVGKSEIQHSMRISVKKRLLLLLGRVRERSPLQ